MSTEKIIALETKIAAVDNYSSLLYLRVHCWVLRSVGLYDPVQ